MIVVKLIGGLGNQMFQYAAGRRLAALHNTALKIDLSQLEANPNGAYTKRHFELGIFNFHPEFAVEGDLTPFKRFSGSRVRRVLFRELPFLFKTAYIAESGKDYNPSFEKYPTNTYLDGFWQNEKYFLSIEAIIRSEFSFKSPLDGTNLAIEQKIKNANAVSLHVRRGDYVTNKNANSFHGICSKEYYEKAVALLNKKEGGLELFVFSDDSAWCKENLRFDHATTYIDHNTGSNSYIDMQLMSLCRHNVIANSSFSWWGAWLNNHSNKTIIAPKNWFVGQPDSICPANWIRI